MGNETGKPQKDAGGNGVQILSQTELEERANESARKILGVGSREEAFAMLDRGDLHGTGAEAVFKSLRFMIDA